MNGFVYLQHFLFFDLVNNSFVYLLQDESWLLHFSIF